MENFDSIVRLLVMLWAEESLELTLHLHEAILMVVSGFAASSFEQKPVVYALLLSILETVGRIIGYRFCQKKCFT